MKKFFALAAAAAIVGGDVVAESEDAAEEVDHGAVVLTLVWRAELFPEPIQLQRHAVAGVQAQSV